MLHKISQLNVHINTVLLHNVIEMDDETGMSNACPLAIITNNPCQPKFLQTSLCSLHETYRHILVVNVNSFILCMCVAVIALACVIVFLFGVLRALF